MKIIFLDRDGVINRFPGIGKYATRPSHIRVLPRSIRAIRALTEAGYEINVISNQGCVSRGMITRQGLERLTTLVRRPIERGGGKIRKFFYCVHQTSDRCACKKPKIHLIKKAARGRRIPWSKSYFIGDSAEDMLAARRAGLRSILVLSGRVKKRNIKDLPAKPDIVKKDLGEAAAWLLKKKS